MKEHHIKPIACTVILSALCSISVDAALISHYTFDVDNAGSTPDSVGSGNSAALGGQVNINTGVAGKIGSGALEMTNVGTGKTPATNGAVTSNNFSWTTDARTISFWWQAKTGGPNDSRTNAGAMVSFGDTSGNGTRFDIKEQMNGTAGEGTLRVEVQGTGLNTNPTNFSDGNWHFVAATVPNGAEFQDISWYVDGSSTDLNTSTNALDIATATGPLVFGDSIIVDPNGAVTIDDRTPNGYMDDFQLYDEVLSEAQILSLYNNPGSVVPEPSAAALLALSGLALLRRRR